jgi:hypothetical protein
MNFSHEVSKLFGCSAPNVFPLVGRHPSEVGEEQFFSDLEASSKLSLGLDNMIQSRLIEDCSSEDFMSMFASLLYLLLKCSTEPALERIYLYILRLNVMRPNVFECLTKTQKNLVGRILIRTLQIRLRGMSKEAFYKSQKLIIQKTWIKNG